MATMRSYEPRLFERRVPNLLHQLLYEAAFRDKWYKKETISRVQ